MIALAAGGLSALVTAFIFKSAKKLHSSGTVFRLDEAIGLKAVVYQRIPKGGVGKISLSLHNLTYEVDAVSCAGEEIPSFTQVQILKKADEKTVVITPSK